jgi:hypothetical protein
MGDKIKAVGRPDPTVSSYAGLYKTFYAKAEYVLPTHNFVGGDVKLSTNDNMYSLEIESTSSKLNTMVTLCIHVTLILIHASLFTSYIYIVLTKPFKLLC